MHPSTFSIVAHDPQSQEWGIAVASKFLAVGAVVPYARAGVGAIATQAHANSSYGPNGLDLMAEGLTAQETLDRLLAADEGRDNRQVGIVDRHGSAASFTGAKCYDWAGGRTGCYFAAQGNILAGPEVVERMAAAFESSTESFVDGLLAALAAGQEAGGDRRGQQSAAILVVKPAGGYSGFNDVYVDLRVDDHPTPIDELRRLLSIHKLYMFKTREEDTLPIDADRARRIQTILRRSGHRTAEPSGIYDEATREEFRALTSTENLEGRWREAPEVDRVVLEYLAARYG